MGAKKSKEYYYDEIIKQLRIANAKAIKAKQIRDAKPSKYMDHELIPLTIDLITRCNIRSTQRAFAERVGYKNITIMGDGYGIKIIYYGGNKYGHN